MTKTKKAVFWILGAVGTALIGTLITNSVGEVSVADIISAVWGVIVCVVQAIWSCLWSRWTALIATFCVGFFLGRITGNEPERVKWIDPPRPRAPQNNDPSNQFMEVTADAAQSLRYAFQNLRNARINGTRGEQAKFDADEKNFQDAMQEYGVDIPSWRGNLANYEDWRKFDSLYEQLHAYLSRKRWKDVKDIVEKYRPDK